MRQRPQLPLPLSNLSRKSLSTALCPGGSWRHRRRRRGRFWVFFIIKSVPKKIPNPNPEVKKSKREMWHEAHKLERKVHDLMDAARWRVRLRAVFLAKRRGTCSIHRDDNLYQAAQDQRWLSMGKLNNLKMKTSSPTYLKSILESLGLPAAVDGQIKRPQDEDIQSNVLEIVRSNVQSTYITCPADPAAKLGIKLPLFGTVVKNLKKYFTFEIQILDDKNVCRRFRASNFQVFGLSAV